MRILLAVDGSEYTRKMLDYVCRNKALFDASHQYTLLHTQPPLPPHARSALDHSQVEDYHREESEKVLQPALTQLQHNGLDAQSQWKVGSSGETIARCADEGGYDMVIMGSHGHGALANLVMGSVSSQVLAGCRVPVLLIR